jgi:hypothetical protein
MPVNCHAALVLGDKMYVLVGDSDRSDSPISFLRYDPGVDAWTALPTPDREWSDLIATDHAIVSMYSPYEQGPKIDQVFDPERGVWAQLPRDPLAPGASRSATWLGDRLLLTATDNRAKGEPEEDRLRMAALDADLQRWTALPDAELGGGYPVGVAGSVAYRSATSTGTSRRSPVLTTRTTPSSIRPPATGTTCRTRRAGRAWCRTLCWSAIASRWAGTWSTR